MTRSTISGGPKRLANCLPERLRSALSAHIDEDSRLRQAWHSRVPEPLASHAHPARYTAGLLFVYVDTAAWASRLRHQLPTLVKSLQTSPAFRGLTDIRFRVSPKDFPRSEPQLPPRPTRLSARAAKVVGDTAATIANPALRAALERLAGCSHEPPSSKRRP